MTDPTITIAGLEARIKCLVAALRSANTGRAEAATLDSAACGYNAQLRTERDALAAQLAEVRAELAKAPKVCAIHSYEHGPGPCMTCGAWPPGTRELIAACQTRIAGLEQAANERAKEDKDRVARMDAIRAALGAHPFASDDHIADRIKALTARVAELEARPVLTEDALHGAIKEGFGDWRYNHGAQGWPGTIQIAVRALAALGRVTLPAQDRAEELAATLVGTARASMTDVPIAWSCDFADGNENARRALTNVVRTALANLSPAPAPTFDAAFLRRVMVATKHGPNGKGGPGPCDAACVKCEAELMAKAAPAREVAPTLVAVSDEDLGRAVWSKYNNADPAAWPNITIGVRAMWTAAARAVRAKLGAAEVTEERVKAALKLLDGITSSDDLTDDESLDDRVTFFMTSLRASAAKGLTAAMGIDRPAPTPTPAPGLDLDAVERAERAMTPGPWSMRRESHFVQIRAADLEELATTEQARGVDVANAAGIVALRNAASALIAEVRRLRAQVDADRRAYLDVCDAIARETSGPADAAAKARATRKERDDLHAKLATAKRLGMEACDLADEATGSASEAPDCAEQVADYRERERAIRLSIGKV